MLRASGVLFQAKDGSILLLRRTDGKGWAFPGGGIEEGESPEYAAIREVEEETGYKVGGQDLQLLTRTQTDDVDYSTYHVKLDNTFDPALNDEHDAFVWVHPSEIETPDGRTDASWEEGRHPRWPKGSPKGGKFMTKGEIEQYGSDPEKAAEKLEKEKGQEGGVEQPSSKRSSSSVSLEKQKEHAQQLSKYLGVIRSVSGSRKNPVFEYGKQFLYDDTSYSGPWGRQHQCYKNAALRAIGDPSVTYTEGFVQVHGVPIEHAWVVDNKSGKVIDPTIRDPSGIQAYYGVPIKTDYLMRTLERERLYGVLTHNNRQIYEDDPSKFVAEVPGGLGVEEEEGPEYVEEEHSPAFSLLEDAPKVTFQDFMASLPEETRARLQSEDERIKGLVSTDAPVSKGGFKTSEGRWTDERAQLHQRIIEHYLTSEAVKAARPKKGEDPTFVVIGGRGGSGKSWLTREGQGPIDVSKYLKIDNDEIKRMLPEYEGWNACQLHEEASDISERIIQMAQSLRLNIILDGTMKSYAPMQERMEGFEKAGYKIHGYYMFAPPKVAAERVVDRFLKSGRYVPPSYVLGSVSNERTFDALRSYFAKWEVYDGSKGFPPRFKFYGGKEKRT